MGDGAAPVTVILPAVIMMHIAASTLGCVTPGCREFGRLARQESLFRDLLDRVASISAVTHLDAVVVVGGAPEVPHLGRARLLALSRVLPPQCQRNQRRGGDYDYRKQPLTAPTWHGTARVLSCAEDIRSGIALLSSRGIFQAMGSSTPIVLVSPSLTYNRALAAPEYWPSWPRFCSSRFSDSNFGLEEGRVQLIDVRSASGALGRACGRGIRASAECRSANLS